MAYIMVKVAPLGKTVVEVSIPEGSNIKAALEAAASRTTTTGYTDLRLNSAPASFGDLVKHGDIITLVPAIRGGI